LPPKQTLRLVQWSIAVDYLVKAIFGLAWAVAERMFMFFPFKMGRGWDYFLDVLSREITSHNPAPRIGTRLARINQLGKLPGMVI
jgi:hypothetical protein